MKNTLLNNSRFFTLTIIIFAILLQGCSSDNDTIQPDTEEAEDQQQNDNEDDDIDAVDRCIDFQVAIGGSGSDIVNQSLITTDGGLLLIGGSQSDISGDKSENSRGDYDFWVVKTNIDGVVQWDKTIGGDAVDMAYTGIETLDGGFLIGGSSTSGISGDKSEPNLGREDLWLVKLSSSGAIEWEETIGGDSYEEIKGLAQTSDGNYVVGATSSSNASEDKSEGPIGGEDYLDFWLLNVDQNGAILWENTIGGTRTDRLYDMALTPTGELLSLGTSVSEAGFDKSESPRGSSDFWIVKTDAAGNLLWDITFGGTGLELVGDLNVLSDGSFAITGGTMSNSSGEITQDTNGEVDYFAAAFTASGSAIWQNTLGGDIYDEGSIVVQRPDGTFLVGGFSGSGVSGDKAQENQGFFDYWITALDQDGNLINELSLGSVGNDYVKGLVPTTDGDFLVIGHSTGGIEGDKTVANIGAEDFWILKLSCLD